MTELTELIKKEHEAIAQSRAIRQGPEEAGKPVDPASIRAICLSGGGVRSATFATGIFNSWAKDGGAILRKFDYLSTVSGGGYFGAFYGRLFERGKDNSSNSKPIDKVYQDLADDHSAPSKYLKRNGRYLANSKDEAFVAAAVLLRNFAWLHFMLLMGFIPLMALMHFGYTFKLIQNVSTVAIVSILFLTPLSLFTLFHFFASTFEKYSKSHGPRILITWMGKTLQVTFGIASLVLITACARYLVENDTSGNWYAGLAAFIAAIYKWYPKVQEFIGKSPSLKVIGYVVATAVFIAYLTSISVLAYVINKWLLQDSGMNLSYLNWYYGFPSKQQEAWLLLIAGSAFTAFILNKFTLSINQTALHYFYAARIRRAFLGAANPKRFSEDKTHNASEYEEGDDVFEIQNYRPDRQGAPLHLMNITLNNSMSPDSNLWWPDCKGQNFAVSGLGCNWSHNNTSLWRCERPSLALGQWVAISGAAASTGMGQSTTGATSLMAALFNIRTGLWWHKGSEHVFYRNFWTELSNRYRSEITDDWYLSDGGHFENLGIYEMVRRRIPRIVAIDAGCDSGFLFEDLGNLFRRVHLDFNCALEVINPAKLTDNSDIPYLLKLSQWQHLFGTLDQLKPAQPEPRWHQETTSVKRVALLHGRFATQNSHSTNQDIWILYIKPTLTRQEPVDVLRYQIEHPDFPHQSTADQFFDEAQWESYRKLGETTATELKAAITQFLS